ncbi:MAG: DUF5671 domain-containing protein [Ardenticatenaceae bacterium]|nr:DUF5671 domain-containing protein [Ardenticatenaceae bacterium]
MKAVQRSYIYIATFVSLAAVVGALIFLIQNLFGFLDRTDLAWQLAVLVIATPIYVGHWLWAERLKRRDEEERPSLIRRLFLYIVLAALLGPALAGAFYLLVDLLNLVAGLPVGTFAFRENIIAIIVLALVWFYHDRILKQDKAVQPETAGHVIIRQLYQWGFTIAGLTMITWGIISFARWIIEQFEGAFATTNAVLIPEIIRLVVGTAVWLIFWLWLQRNFAENIGGERDSVVRKLFLYAILFVGLVLTVTNLALLWDGVLLGWFGQDIPGDLSDIVPLVLGGGLVWGYHWTVLRREAQRAPLAKQQLLIRHIYQYLTAAVGLIATLIGIAGLISILILTLGGDPLDIEGVAGFLATLTAGLPVWLWPWWLIQKRVTGSEEEAQAESGSLVRRIYLYLFLLIATLTILGSGIYLVFRLFSLLFRLDTTGESNTDLALAAAYAIIALVVWLYHGRLLQVDGRRLAAQRAEKLADVSVVLIDPGPDEGGFSIPLLETLRKKMPHVGLETIRSLAEEAVAPLATADIVVASWETVRDEPFEQLLQGSAAEKVLLPTPTNGWLWAGVDGGQEAVLQDAAVIVEKLALKEGGLERRRWGVGTVIAAIAGGIVGLCILVNLIGSILGAFF